MSFSDLATRVGKLVADNSPAIFTGIGAVGAITTAYLTGRASFKAAQLIERDETTGGTAGDPKQRFKERFQLTWKLYIPAAASATVTVSSIILANRIGHRRAAALAAAYAISEKAFGEYKDKVVEKFGEKKEQAVRDELAQDRVKRQPFNDIFVVGEGTSVLCFDSFTGRYFLSDVETLRKAQNDINYEVNNNYYASLSDFYEKIGLPATKMSDEFGWNADTLLDLSFSTTLTEKNVPCLVIDFRVDPIRGFHRVS
jgi:hypothetical protein